jgi:hypothetical protein
VIKLGELVMILDLHRQGLSVSAIARQLCIDRKTVRSAIAKGLEPPKYKTPTPRPRITDPFEPYLKERLAAYPGLTAVRLWREVKERGYAGGCSVLRDCVRDLRPPRSAGFEVRFETPPGQQAQVDFAHFEVEFADEPGVIGALAKAEREGALREKIRFFCRFALLIVDEIGYLPVIPGGGNLFFQLVNARYEKGAMILTSNRGFSEWGQVFGDPVVATALLDRLLHHATVIQIEGASYRLREHADLVPENIRSKSLIQPSPIPPTLKRRGRPPKSGGLEQDDR